VNNLTRDLAGTYVDVYELACGRIQVRAKGVALPYTIMNPVRRITPAAITENKQHLSAVLTHIKRRMEKATPPPKVKPVSAQRLPQERASTRQTIQAGAVLRGQTRSGGTDRVRKLTLDNLAKGRLCGQSGHRRESVLRPLEYRAPGHII